MIHLLMLFFSVIFFAFTALATGGVDFSGDTRMRDPGAAQPSHSDPHRGPDGIDFQGDQRLTDRDHRSSSSIRSPEQTRERSRSDGPRVGTRVQRTISGGSASIDFDQLYGQTLQDTGDALLRSVESSSTCVKEYLSTLAPNVMTALTSDATKAEAVKLLYFFKKVPARVCRSSAGEFKCSGADATGTRYIHSGGGLDVDTLLNDYNSANQALGQALHGSSSMDGILLQVLQDTSVLTDLLPADCEASDATGNAMPPSSSGGVMPPSSTGGATPPIPAATMGVQ